MRFSSGKKKCSCSPHLSLSLPSRSLPYLTNGADQWALSPAQTLNTKDLTFHSESSFVWKSWPRQLGLASLHISNLLFACSVLMGTVGQRLSYIEYPFPLFGEPLAWLVLAQNCFCILLELGVLIKKLHLYSSVSGLISVVCEPTKLTTV